MIAKARTVGAKGGGALLSYILGEAPGKDPEKIEVLMKRNVPDWCLWAEDYANMFAVDSMSYSGKSQKNQIDIIISPDAEQTKNWTEEFWEGLRKALPEEFKDTFDEDIVITKSTLKKLTAEQKSVIWNEPNGRMIIKRYWKDNWIKLAEDYIAEMDKANEEEIPISERTYLKLKNKHSHDIITRDGKYYRKRKYAELQLRKAKAVAALHKDAASGIGHIHIEASRIVNGKVMDDHFLGLRAKVAAESLCKKYGWETAAERSVKIKSDILNKATDYLRRCGFFDFNYNSFYGEIIGKGWNDFKEAMKMEGWNIIETQDSKGKIIGYTYQNIDQPYRNYKASSISASLALDKLSVWQPRLKAEYLRNRRLIGRKCYSILMSLTAYDQDIYINKLKEAFGDQIDYKKDSNGKLVSYSVNYGGKQYKSSDLQCEKIEARSLTPSRLADSWAKIHVQEIPETKKEQENPEPAKPNGPSGGQMWLDLMQMREQEIMTPELQAVIKDWEAVGAKSKIPRAGIRILRLPIDNIVLKLTIDANSGNAILIIDDGNTVRTIPNPVNLNPLNIAIQTIKDIANDLDSDRLQAVINAYNDMIWAKWSMPNGTEPWNLTYDGETHPIYLSPDADKEMETAKNNKEAYSSDQDHLTSMVDAMVGFIGIITTAQSSAMATSGGGGGNGSDLPWRDRRDDEDDVSWARYCIGRASTGRLAPPGGLGGQGGTGGRGGRGGRRR